MITKYMEKVIGASIAGFLKGQVEIKNTEKKLAWGAKDKYTDKVLSTACRVAVKEVMFSDEQVPRYYYEVTKLDLNSDFTPMDKENVERVLQHMNFITDNIEESKRNDSGSYSLVLRKFEGEDTSWYVTEIYKLGQSN